MAPLVPDTSLLCFSRLWKKLCFSKRDILHPGLELPSSVMFTSDGASHSRHSQVEGSWVRILVSAKELSKLSIIKVHLLTHFAVDIEIRTCDFAKGHNRGGTELCNLQAVEEDGFNCWTVTQNRVISLWGLGSSLVSQVPCLGAALGVVGRKNDIRSLRDHSL